MHPSLTERGENKWGEGEERDLGDILNGCGGEHLQCGLVLFGFITARARMICRQHLWEPQFTPQPLTHSHSGILISSGNSRISEEAREEPLGNETV